MAHAFVQLLLSSMKPGLGQAMISNSVKRPLTARMVGSLRFQGLSYSLKSLL